ncbi:MAG: right-handed parallel beta-helix repeat-containing protein [Planctomycetota bacterium]|jgi:parallel beta-helix repeat protein
MFHRLSKQISLGIFVVSLLLTMPVYAINNYNNIISNYGGAHQIWFEAEDYDERNPDTDRYYPVVDAADAFGQAINRGGGAGGMIRWTFDISAADGKGGTWYFWARILNPANQSDYMLVEGDPDDADIPPGPSFPGGDGAAPFDNGDDRIFEENVGPPWGWARAGHEEGHTKELQDGENTMYIFHRQGNATVFWDVFMWTDSPNYVPTDEDYQNARTGLGFGPASGPDPADGAIYEDTWVSLSWRPGDHAVSHDVYFGENFDDVNNGAESTFQGNQPSNYILAGLPEWPYPGGLVPGTTYYWRVDEVESDGVTKHKGEVWSFFVPSGKAHSPYPADGAESIDTDMTLTWAAGLGATLHTVYFGDDPEAVANAVEGTPQMLSRYYPGALEFDKTYYWRVDEFDGAVTHKGDVWSFTTMPADAFWAAAYYVDEGNHVANDGNPGTEARPFKTIGGGVQSLQPGDTLLIKAGTYREAVILHRSGTHANPIRIRAYPGDEGKAIINAAEPVTDWQKCAGPGDCAGNPYWEHIYVADVAALVQSHPDSEFAVRQVFQHGELLKRSRYPDGGWSYPTSVPDQQTAFTDSSVSKPDRYFNGSVCHIKTAIWQIDQIPVAGFSNSTITLAKSPRYDISTRFGYYLTSIVGEINEEGEWAYDPSQKKIFLWPRGDVAEDVEFSYRRYCLRSYSGTSWNVVRGLTMRNAYWYGIFLYRSNDMALEDNTVEHAYNFGIHLYAGAGARGDNNQIVRNTIEYSASRGINVDKVCSHTNVEGNYVYATGAESFGADLMNGRGEAIYVRGPHTRVYNNRIDRTGHTGINVSGKTLSRDFSYNYITNIKLALSDGGGIYGAGFSDVPEKDHIHHNIIVDVIGCRTMDRNRDKGLPVTIEKYSGDSAGIFVDEGGNNRIIEHNTVINSHMAGIHFYKAPGNVVQNNTLYGNKVAQIWFSGRNQPGEKLVDEVVLDNIMFATDAQQKTFFLELNYDNVHFGRSDNNYLYNPYSYRHILHILWTSDTRDELTLNEWRALSGYDGNSREFSYLDQFEDITIDTQEGSRITHNPSLDVIDVDLESDKYCDVQGNKIYRMVTLQPFESKILIPCDF